MSKKPKPSDEESERVPVKLDAADIAERSQQEAVLVETIRTYKAETRAIAKERTKHADDLERKLVAINQTVLTGVELRVVSPHFLPESRTAELVDDQTGIVIGTRAMTDDEMKEHRQTKVFSLHRGGAGRGDPPSGGSN